MAVKINILILLVLLGLGGGAPVQKACAQTIAPQTCDTQVWQTMDAKARLETEREIMANQTLIYKPDSILNYTCFDQFAAHATANLGVLFTHTTYFGGSPILPWSGSEGMDTAIDRTVIASLQTYLSENFRHTYLGGRGDEVGLSVKPGPGQNVSPQGRSYACNHMGQVWAIAKCINFNHNGKFNDTDGFYPFADLAPMTGGQPVKGYQQIGDTRRFPTACGGTPVTGSTWEQLYAWSKNTSDRYYPYGVPLNETFTQVRDMVKPGNCGTARAILTGVKVVLSPSSTTTYDDGVCTNAGCTYKKDGTCAGS